MSDFKEVIIRLQSDPEFHKLLEKLKEERPKVPPYNHKKDNTETWKALSLQREGYDMVLSILEIEELA